MLPDFHNTDDAMHAFSEIRNEAKLWKMNGILTWKIIILKTYSLRNVVILYYVEIEHV